MRIIIMLLLCLALSACQTTYTPRPAEPMPVPVSDDCWQACAQSPLWTPAADGSGDFDVELGTNQPTIENQKTQCEANRKACADALQRLIDVGAITITGKPR